MGPEGLLGSLETLPCREGLLWGSLCIKRVLNQLANLEMGRWS